MLGGCLAILDFSRFRVSDEAYFGSLGHLGLFVCGILRVFRVGTFWEGVLRIFFRMGFGFLTFQGLG